MINRIEPVEPADRRQQRLLPNYRDSGPPLESWAENFGERLGKYIGDHPVLSLTVGLTVGIFLGCLIKRR